MASECAGEQGRFHEYEETVYVNWNGVNQGTYSDENLRIFAEMTGLFLNQYDDCMSSNKYLSKIEDDRDAASELGVNSTPSLFLNGVKLENNPDYGYYRVRLEEALNEVGG
jgi:protein-disulfide isomerase